MNRETIHSPAGPPAAGRHWSVLLSATRRGARLARRLTVQQLIDWDAPFELPEQIVAELAANAVLHGRSPGRSFRLTLTARTDGTLLIAVTDARPDRSLPAEHPAPGAGAESGRGLLIVARLAARWGVAFSGVRKTVWAECRPVSLRSAVSPPGETGRRQPAPRLGETP